MVEHPFCVGFEDLLAHVFKMHVLKPCSILLRYCWSVTNNNVFYHLVQVCSLFIFENRHGALGNFDTSICTWKLTPLSFQLPMREDSSLSLERDVRSWGFEPVHQTSSYGCYRCQQSYTRCHFLLGQSLHYKACKYWATLFLDTCDMCTPSQVTKQLSIYIFLTQPLRHHIDSYLLLKHRLDLIFH